MKQLFNEIRCDQLSGEVRATYDNLATDICAIDRYKYVLTCCSIFTLIAACFYIWRKYEKCHKSLLAFHNLRAAVSLLLLAVNSLELARSLLPQRDVDQLNLLFESPPMELNVMIVIGAGAVWNALAAILLTIMLMCYHRLLERKKVTVFLYGSIAVELLIFILRLYELAEVAYFEDFLELETSLASVAVLSLLTLAIFDAYTIYKERYRDDYLDNYDRIGYKHSLATFYSKTCFWWLTPLLWLGYKEPLELSDLGHMRLEDSARAHYDRFLYIYTEKVKKSSAPPSLWYCYMKNSWRMFALGGILKLAGDLFALIGPLAIQQIVQYIEGLYAAAQEHSTGQELEQELEQEAGNPNAATDVAADDVYYDSGLIYRKTLLLNASSGCGNNATDVLSTDDDAAAAADVQRNGDIKLTASEQPGEVDAAQQQTERPHDIGAITNHMTEDTLNIMQFFWISHYAWAIPFKIALVIYLLYLKLGVSAVAGAIVCIVIMTPLQFLIGNAMSKNAHVIAKYTDERLKRIHDTLIGIKIIKLNAWDEVFLRKIQAARKQELKYLNKDAMYWTFMTILTHISTVLITLVTLAIYVCLPQDLRPNFNASHLFSALALFQQLTVPLLIFPITVPIIIAARVSTRRLERFLHAPEIHKQFEGIRNMARILSKSDASLDMYETQEKSNMTLRTAHAENKLNEQRLALRLRLPEQPPSPAPLAQSEPITPLLQGNSEPPDDKSHELGHHRLVQQRRELLRNTPYVAIRPPKLFGGTAEKPLEFSVVRARNTDSWRRDSLLLKMPDDIAVSINDGLFSWQPQRQLPLVQLHIQEMAIPKGKLSIIVGKNGSGKTSLLSALLMEMPLLAGNMFWHKNCTISYVPQCPWLLNDTIRENILFGESFRPKRYDFVLNACALKPDIELMPSGDFTIIGERGINLSGGQRQRIAIARAIYSSANVVIMDDPLSSLDNEVGNHVFEQCVRQMLLKSNRSIILVTQQLQLIKEADYLIVMKDGRLQACGSYKDIELKQPHIIAKWNSIIAKANANAKDPQQQNNAERTARERWKLFKNVSKLGLQRSISVTSEAGNDTELDAADNHVEIRHTLSNADERDEDEDEDDDMPASAGSFNLHRKRSSVYGSRHLIYDVPLPIDECQADDVIMRPRRRAALHRRGSSAKSTNSWHRLSGLSTATATSTSSTNSGDLLRRSVLTASCSSYADSSVDGGDSASGAITPPLPDEQCPRAQSWQPPQKLHHPQVQRNVSSPPAMEATATGTGTTASGDEALATTAAATTAAAQTRGSFQQFLRRMSMRRSNKPKHHHRPLSAANSIRYGFHGDPTCNRLLPILVHFLSYRRIYFCVSDVKIDLNALPTNARNNNNNNDDNGDDVSDVTSLALQSAQPEAVPGVDEAEAGAVQRSGGVASTMTTRATTKTATTTRTRTRTMAAADGERKYGQISHNIYLLYMRASGLPIIVAFFITTLIWQCLRVYTDVWLQHWSDHVPPTVAQQPQPQQQQQQHRVDMESDEVTYYFRMYATISCVCIIMAMISTPAGQWAGCNARRNLHDKLLQTILHKTLHFFQVTPLGRIVNRFSNDMAIIDKKIAATSQRLLQFSLLCLFAILINVSITPWFLALTLPICGAYYAIQKFYRCSARELQRIENSTNSPVISHLSETIQGVTTIRAYNQQARFTEILFKRLEANTIAFTILNTSNRWLGISLDYLGGCIVFVAIVTALATASVSCSSYVKAAPATYAINKSASAKELTPTPSLVGLAINYTLLVPIYLNWVVKLLADMEMFAGSVERIAHYAQQQPEPELESESESELESEEELEQEPEEERHKQDVVEISNEVDRNPRAVDKVYPGTTSAAVDVDGDTAVATAAATAASYEDADKLNAGNVRCNHFNFHPAPVDDKLQQQAGATPAAMIKDTRMTPLDDKVAPSNEPARRIKTYQSVPISWPQRGDITFANVSLRYEGQRRNVITHLNLKIPAGQRIGICGRTGSGKSSLALSLFGVLQTTSGRICIDDVDIEQIRADELRTRLSIIPQDVHLFNATIRENLDPHGYYSDLQLWNCLELAQLKEFVNVQLPLGLDTEITDGGISLSAGHRQLLCLARAILRGSVCLVLDEATSTLDSSTERALLKAADKAFNGRTIITIAVSSTSLDASWLPPISSFICFLQHRLSTILDYERIIVLEQGRIVEDGNPRQLQQQSDSIFHGLLSKGEQQQSC
ncbi:hypothetical protein KR093_007269 [Drosophila rubida]|uniref:ATP-binding cassette sub-family C member Sur n=1 Tax=Drosophila rubida TaxID=30044 RepID=A0AAD4K5D0_9MUSC|nr:hypothetical protein KR093_007269 [Drosophila rubida]